MTIEKLLGMSADELDKLTQAELEAYFAPYLDITRPSQTKPSQNAKVALRQQTIRRDDKIRRALKMLGEEADFLD